MPERPEVGLTFRGKLNVLWSDSGMFLVRTVWIAFSCAALLGSASAQAGPKLLFDPADGRVLYAEDVDDRWYPASLTKLMTAYLVFEALEAGRITPETKITTSEAAHAQPPSKIGLPVGGEMSVDLALQALIVKSANDVAVMLAEAVGGSEQAFVDRMNATAARLGMTETHFVNPNGLPADGQVTTARDLARLSIAVTREYPKYQHLWALPNFRIGKRRLGSHNGLLKTYVGADGLKTGFICDSGFNMVASATRDGRQLMAVILGEPSGQVRTLRAASLLDHGFATYGWKQLFGSPSLETLPVSSSPKPVVSVRDTVTSWSCGRRPSRVVKAKGSGRKAAGKPRTSAAVQPPSGASAE